MIKAIPRPASGFTLVELLIASLAAGFVTAAASSAVTYHMRASASMEAVERTKQDWGRVSHFIEAEVALSERVITNSSNINLNQCNQTIQDSEFLFALEIRRDLPAALYYITNNQAGTDQWSGSQSLFRCGPGIDELGEYTDAITGSNQVVNDSQRLIDGMTSECDLTVINPPASGIGKSLQYQLCLQGLSKRVFQQTISTYSRVSPIYSYPPITTLCSDDDLRLEGFAKVDGGTTAAETLNTSGTAIPDDQEVLICGNGGGDTITGSLTNDVLEAGEIGPGAWISGRDGNDRLRGSPGNDTLKGEGGDDVLLGGGGNDQLEGGSGENRYLPGDGTNTITGGDGLDVVFFDGDKADYTGLNACKRATCSVTTNSQTTTITNGEVLVFRDGRFDLR